MSDGSTPIENTTFAGVSPLRLRVGVILILLWWTPLWLLAPYIANSLTGVSNPPSVSEVTTIIVVAQTIIGLIGFWAAGTGVKSIIKGSTKRHALGVIWSIFLHGEIRAQADAGNDQNKRRSTPEDAE